MSDFKAKMHQIRFASGAYSTQLWGTRHKQTVHTHLASVHQAAKLVAALLRVARVTAGMAESNGRPPVL